MLNEQRTFGLIGYPLSHSFSKKYFTEKFEKEGISGCTYELFELPGLQQLPSLIRTTPALSGLNVTIPYKESVLPFLDALDENAEKTGAVNCIRITRDESGRPQLKGYNTDITGFRQSIKPFLDIRHERALILGTGGAAKAALHVLKEIGIDCYMVTRNKAEARVKGVRLLDYDELNRYVMQAFKLIVNATPLGMFPHTEQLPALPYEYITPDHLLYDMIYNPPETGFLKQGRLQGAQTVNGLSMLQLQAEAAWKIWNG